MPIDPISIGVAIMAWGIKQCTCQNCHQVIWRDGEGSRFTCCRKLQCAECTSQSQANERCLCCNRAVRAY